MPSPSRKRSLLSADELRLVRELMDLAFADEGFDDDDWIHTVGGDHLCVWENRVLLAHAAVVPRTIEVDGVPFSTGYVEGVAVRPERQGCGMGTEVMGRAGDVIRAGYELGVLGTGAHHFYERLGWERWRGESSVRHPVGRLERTVEDDDGLMLLRFGPSADVSLQGRIVCEWRPGDVW